MFLLQQPSAQKAFNEIVMQVKCKSWCTRLMFDIIAVSFIHGTLPSDFLMSKSFCFNSIIFHDETNINKISNQLMTHT